MASELRARADPGLGPRSRDFPRHLFGGRFWHRVSKTLCAGGMAVSLPTFSTQQRRGLAHPVSGRFGPSSADALPSLSLRPAHLRRFPLYPRPAGLCRCLPSRPGGPHFFGRTFQEVCRPVSTPASPSCIAVLVSAPCFLQASLATSDSLLVGSDRPHVSRGRQTSFTLASPSCIAVLVSASPSLQRSLATSDSLALLQAPAG
jgi:hypothetical protein